MAGLHQAADDPNAEIGLGHSFHKLGRITSSTIGNRAHESGHAAVELRGKRRTLLVEEPDHILKATRYIDWLVQRGDDTVDIVRAQIADVGAVAVNQTMTSFLSSLAYASKNDPQKLRAAIKLAN